MELWKEKRINLEKSGIAKEKDAEDKIKKTDHWVETAAGRYGRIKKTLKPERRKES